MRRPLIAGNWKMFTDPGSATKLARELKAAFLGCEWADVVVCPPFISIPAVISALSGSIIEVGAQNMHWEKEGAFTGEVSGNMLKGSGCQWVIIGHSERRTYFSETNQGVSAKIRAAIACDLQPIACLGETLEERESGLTEEIVNKQFTEGPGSLKDIGKLAIAYEPVWAIGTGKNATPAQAQEVHRLIRGLILDMWGADSASSVRLLYGGSVKPENAASLWAQEDIDGFLVGGASLNAESFFAIARAVK
jgi:triosephosphate isomerase